MATVAELITKLGFRTDTKPLENIEHRLESLNHKLRLIVGTEVIKKLYEMTSEFGHSALELENVAASAGLTTDAMQRLQYAVTQSGGNAGELGMTMTHLARMIDGAKRGAEDALQTFYLLGIDSNQIASFRDTEDALYGVMDALQKIQDPLRRQAMMDRALGQGSRGLGRFALSGRQAALASQQMLKQLGVIVPKSTLDRLAQARVSVMSLGLVFKAIGSNIGGTFAPVVVRVVEDLTKFYAANKAVIELTFDKWIYNASYALGFFVGLLQSVGGAMLRFLSRHEGLIDRTIKFSTTVLGLGYSIKILGFALRALSPALSVLKSGWKAAGLLLNAAVPITYAAGIMLLVAALHDLWTLLGGGKYEDTWLYQAFKGQGVIGKGIQSLIGVAVKAMDATGLTALGPEVADQPIVRGMLPDDDKLQTLVKKANGMMHAQQVVSSMRIGAQGTPAMLERPALTASPYQPPAVTMNVQNTINVPPQVTAEGAERATTKAVQLAHTQHLLSAMMQQQTALGY